MPYDLLVKGGHVLDPGQGLDGVMDIGITAGKIAAVAPNIPTIEAKRFIQVRGDRRYVTPGLIDLHAHIAHGMQSPGVNWQASDPHLAGVGSGVTTIVDGGTCGAYNFGVMPTWVVPNSKTRVLCFLNIGTYGLSTSAPLKRARPEVIEPANIDVEASILCGQANPDLIKGIKVRLVGPAVESMGTQLVDMALEAARGLNVPLMTHIGDPTTESPKAPSLTEYLISRLNPYDIITHICTGHSGGLLGPDKKVMPSARERRADGVTMDSAAGRNNWSYDVARAEADQGFYPDTISTDISLTGRSDIVFGITEIMSKFLACGYSLGQVVQMTTANSAKALRMENEIGAIKVGHAADLTILDDVTGRWRFVDTHGVHFNGEHALVPVLTIRAGETISPDWGPHPWGWLPEEA